MGGGYSGKFIGTAGAIGANKNYQSSLFDVEPVRTKTNVVSIGGAGGGVSAIRMKRCRCCEKPTLPMDSEHEICPLCGWIDDKFQNTHPDSPNGKNLISLNEARVAYKKSLDSNG